MQEKKEKSFRRDRKRGGRTHGPGRKGMPWYTQLLNVALLQVALSNFQLTSESSSEPPFLLNAKSHTAALIFLKGPDMFTSSWKDLEIFNFPECRWSCSEH